MYGFIMFDPLYFLFALPGLILALIAQAYVKKAYHDAAQIRSRYGKTGADIAREILRAYNVTDVIVEPTHGILTDHYHPNHKALRLSEANYNEDTLAAVGISAHEVGHAIQHNQGYFPVLVRSALVPLAFVGSNFAYLLFTIGAIVANTGIGQQLMLGAIALFGAAFLFTIVTLPVEFDASLRAVKILEKEGILTEEELKPVRRVLKAAALTYIAGAVQALLILLYFIMRFQQSRE